MFTSQPFRYAFILTALMIAAMPLAARAEALPAKEQEFFDKHISDVIQLVPSRLNDASFLKVFATPFYKVKVLIQEGGGTSTNEVVVARVGDKLVSIDRPGTDTTLGDFAKMLNPDFKLHGDADARLLQAALDVVYPIIGSDDDKKAEGFKHAGNEWTFIRGTFFDKKMGFVFEVDANGAVKTVKYVLKLP